MQTIWQDVRYAWRGLTHQPGFTALAVLTLGLGIGAATTMFSVIQNVLVNPFPYTDPQRVVSIQIRDTSSARPGGRTFFQERDPRPRTLGMGGPCDRIRITSDRNGDLYLTELHPDREAIDERSREMREALVE